MDLLRRSVIGYYSLMSDKRTKVMDDQEREEWWREGRFIRPSSLQDTEF